VNQRENIMQRRIITKGFTLIELMITVAIVGILAAIAYPSYTEQIRKNRRADAKAVLLELTQWMERFYTENSRYDQNRAGTAVALPFAKSPKEGGPASGYYTIALATPAQNQFTLTATPAGPQVGDTCGNLTLDRAGVKCANGSCSNGSAAAKAVVATCW
jgi:type IV pilus assembly protein PilE